MRLVKDNGAVHLLWERQLEGLCQGQLHMGAAVRQEQVGRQHTVKAKFLAELPLACIPCRHTSSTLYLC